MKIGFDLDGTVLTQDLGLLRVINKVASLIPECNDELMQFYCAQRNMNFNPLDFVDDNDEMFFITGRAVAVEQLSINWAKKYFPMAKITVTKVVDAVRDQDKMKNWYDLQAEAKAKVINDLGIEVYFEDCPEIVIRLRKLCPTCKTIKYGCRQVTEL
jgi:hypothetical protein